ncbi:discoidin domain-containing protein [Streptomyces sp. NPDC096354]|uniref:discoidin domain-containing protein n=1 Tax=Streptomyces sp. NPDC096354 TaxID=3366088 RepID=UPI00382D8189
MPHSSDRADPRPRPGSRAWEVSVSNDGTTWHTAATGTGTGRLTNVDLRPTTARHVRVTATGTAGNQDQRDVVRGVRGVQLVERPQSFLAVCERMPVVTPVTPVGRTGQAAHAPSPRVPPQKGGTTDPWVLPWDPEGPAVDARSRGNSPVP